MREHKTYICDLCGKEFTQGYPEGYNKCEEHERSHVKPEPYAIMNKGSYRLGDKYPSYITVPMADGAEIVYKFDTVLKPDILDAELEQKESPLKED